MPEAVPTQGGRCSDIGWQLPWRRLVSLSLVDASVERVSVLPGFVRNAAIAKHNVRILRFISLSEMSERTPEFPEKRWAWSFLIRRWSKIAFLGFLVCFLGMLFSCGCSCASHHWHMECSFGAGCDFLIFIRHTADWWRRIRSAENGERTEERSCWVDSARSSQHPAGRTPGWLCKCCGGNELGPRSVRFSLGQHQRKGSKEHPSPIHSYAPARRCQDRPRELARHCQDSEVEKHQKWSDLMLYLSVSPPSTYLVVFFYVFLICVRYI